MVDVEDTLRDELIKLESLRGKFLAALNEVKKLLANLGASGDVNEGTLRLEAKTIEAKALCDEWTRQAEKIKRLKLGG